MCERVGKNKFKNEVKKRTREILVPLKYNGAKQAEFENEKSRTQIPKTIKKKTKKVKQF